MWLIFTASGDSASVQHSSRLIGPILHWLFPNISTEASDFIILCVRKCAHLTEYAVLSLLVWRALHNATAQSSTLDVTVTGDRALVASKRGTGEWNRMHAALSVLTVLLYAATDELHQYFVANRNASVRDVCIDTLGGLMGILLLWMFGRWRKFL